MQLDIELYITETGLCPFNDWFDRLHDAHTCARIMTRLERLKMGNFGDCKSLGEGIAELRIHFGPGLRIYYSKIANKIILLLCGGDKGSQTKDINKAKEYLLEFQKREKRHGKK